jgi:hypothetical protein
MPRQQQQGHVFHALLNTCGCGAACRIQDVEAKYYANGEDAYEMRKFFSSAAAGAAKRRGKGRAAAASDSGGGSSSGSKAEQQPAAAAEVEAVVASS